MTAAGEAVRVLIADDHPLYVDGLLAAIEGADGLELAAACADGPEALTQIVALAPDVAAINHVLPGLDAPAIAAAVEEAAVATRVLVFSAGPNGPAIYDAIQAGAVGYIPKSWTRARVCEAIRTIASGRSLYAEELHDSISREIRSRGVATNGRLTTREREILLLLADGRSAPQIAGVLYLSVSTVKTHLHRLYEKLAVTDRAAAVATAMRQGLIR